MKIDLSPEWQDALKQLVEQARLICQRESPPSPEHIRELRCRGIVFEREGGLAALTREDVRLVEKRNGE
jgi:hypothetical protein